MQNKLIEQNPISSFFIRYKKWIVAAVGIQLIPALILVSVFLGIAMYLFVNNDANWHAYKSDIRRGYNAGLEDGVKSRGISNSKIDYLLATPWDKYETETIEMQEQVVKEADEYLAQFPEEERGSKRAQMKIDNVKLPLEKALEKRFKKALAFYADFVAQQIKREAFASDMEYEAALKKEAWKVGYEYGYARAWAFGKWRSEKLS